MTKLIKWGNMEEVEDCPLIDRILNFLNKENKLKGKVDLGSVPALMKEFDMHEEYAEQIVVKYNQGEFLNIGY
tara:strand:+ start:4809 stop:5027 length:219 start_codon:yes stop_codon:yes gene_type:complete